MLTPARAPANPVAIGAVALAMALQLTTVLDLLAGILHVTPLSAAEWCVLVGLAALPAVAGQLFKGVRRS